MKSSETISFTEYVDALKKLPADKRNTEQQAILDLLEKQPVDFDKIAELFKKDKAFKGLPKQWKALTGLKAETIQKETIIDVGDQEPGQESEPVEGSTAPKALNIIYYDVEFSDADNEIHIKLRKPDEPVPGDIFLFIKGVDEVQNAIKELYSDNLSQRSHLKTLEGIARVGGTSTYIELAKQQLEQYKQEIILQKGSEIKHKYLKELGVAGLVVLLISSILLVIPQVFNIQYQYSDIYHNGILLIMGASIGTWLSFAIRKKEISFEDLRILNGNMRNPTIRMLVLVLIALSFYFMFITNFLNIEVGDSFSTGSVGEKGYESLAFLLGIFIGLAENSIGLSLTRRIETFTSKL